MVKIYFSYQWKSRKKHKTDQAKITFFSLEPENILTEWYPAKLIE